jgi:UDPglucose--hexose-1-phosphate uridylyltransferase
MPVELFKNDGRLVWIRNPFTDTITYFTDVHLKRSGYRRQLPLAALGAALAGERGAAATDEELDAVRRQCPFCPGNEQMTPPELLRIHPADVDGQTPAESPWLLRAFNNVIPRIPECCTGGRNESYVLVEDPRHFVAGARHHGDLLHTGLLSAAHVHAILRANVEVARLAYGNPAVSDVLIRKNQGRESGASQPHIHNQVIGCDRPFQPVRQERDRLAREPGLWREILRVMDGEGYVIAREGGCVLYFCPFGVFPRSYEVVCEDAWGRITEADAGTLAAFAALLHQALRILEPLPLDYEIHDGPGVPLHAHVSARHFPYSNIGGTLNLPANLSLDTARERAREESSASASAEKARLNRPTD